MIRASGTAEKSDDSVGAPPNKEHKCLKRQNRRLGEQEKISPPVQRADKVVGLYRFGHKLVSRGSYPARGTSLCWPGESSSIGVSLRPPPTCRVCAPRPRFRARDGGSDRAVRRSARLVRRRRAPHSWV